MSLAEWEAWAHQPPAPTDPGQVIPSNAPTGPTGAQRDAYATLQQLFNQYGLGSLNDWLWGQITSGSSTDQIMLALTQQPAYLARFPGQALRTTNGYAQLTPDAYLATEGAIRDALRSNGLDAPDDPALYAAAIGNDKSASEIDANLRIYHTVATTFTPYMRQLFDTHAGMNVTHDDVYNMFQGNNTALAQQYALATGTNAPTQEDLQNWLTQAQDAEKALFHPLTGGGTAKGLAAELTTTSEATY